MKKLKLKKIIFIGEKIFKDKRLKEVIASDEHKFWKFISRNVYINQELINLDKRLLENYLKIMVIIMLKLKIHLLNLIKILILILFLI